MKRPLKIGIVGATGLVGETFLQLMSRRKTPTSEIRLFASDRSIGQTRSVSGQNYAVEALIDECFKGLDVVFFSVGEELAKVWAPQAVQAGAFAIDNSSAFRMQPNVPLIVPEINFLTSAKNLNSPCVVANPNCSTIQLVLALAPLHRDLGLESVHVATYQAVSGAGLAGQQELEEGLKTWASSSPSEAKSKAQPSVFAHSIALNCIPAIGAFDESGFCTEELKIIRESKKIMTSAGLRKPFRLTAFTVRVPVWNGHSEAVAVRFEHNVTREQIMSSLTGQKGLKVYPESQSHNYPVAQSASGADDVMVGRIHQDLEDQQTWWFWIVADNVLKGAALNGLQIAERIFDIS